MASIRKGSAGTPITPCPDTLGGAFEDVTTPLAD